MRLIRAIPKSPRSLERLVPLPGGRIELRACCICVATPLDIDRPMPSRNICSSYYSTLTWTGETSRPYERCPCSCMRTSNQRMRNSRIPPVDLTSSLTSPDSGTFEVHRYLFSMFFCNRLLYICLKVGSGCVAVYRDLGSA